MFNIPLYLILLVCFFLICLTVEAGYRYGIQTKKNADEVGESVLELVPTSLLGLLALLLGFTFSMSIHRFDVRKRALVNEANAIETAFLRTDFLPPTESMRAKHAIKNYLNHRVHLPRSGSAETSAYAQKNRELQAEIWRFAKEMGQTKPTPISASFILAVNSMFDLGGERSFAADDHVPEIVYYVIFGIMIVSLFSFSFIYGVQRRSRLSPLLIGFLLVLVFVLIQDLDRSARGIIRVDLAVLTDLQKNLKTDSP